MRFTVALLAGLLLLPTLLPVTGCKKNGGDASGSSSSGTDEENPKDSDALVSAKLKPIIDGSNVLGPRIHGSERQYVKTTPESGPTEKEHGSSFQSCAPIPLYVENMKKTKGQEPALPALDAARDAYVDALTALTPTCTELERYYEQGDYKDDKLAKGRALHGPLLAAFEKFDKADAELSHQIDALNDDISKRRVARLQKDPKRYGEYVVEKTMLDAEVLVNISNKLETIADLDAAKWDPAVAQLEGDAKTLGDFRTQRSAEADKIMMLSMFGSREDALLKAAKELGRRKRDKKDFSTEKNIIGPANIDGHPAQILKAYNDLVSTANSMTFR